MKQDTLSKTKCMNRVKYLLFSIPERQKTRQVFLIAHLCKTFQANVDNASWVETV